MLNLAVFSTSVEVFPKTWGFPPTQASLLHVRGGVSINRQTKVVTNRSSPRPWRCFSNRPLRLHIRLVFSTSVEVFPNRQIVDRSLRGLLHVRGGVSTDRSSRGQINRSSPRPWRCFWHPPPPVAPAPVFSTSVEVFPRMRHRDSYLRSLLHVRGRVSVIPYVRKLRFTSSPRPWRCFQNGLTGAEVFDVFSTSVEVFLEPAAEARPPIASSPRPWRCFRRLLILSCSLEVFSTSVEVFLWLPLSTSPWLSLLHVRGGVSSASPVRGGIRLSSPRPWRCF